MAVEEWFVLDRGKMRGPYSLDQVRSMRESGICPPFTRVSRDQITWHELDDYLARQGTDSTATRPPPIFDKVFASFPVSALMLLHYLTAGIYSFLWITSLHGRLPKVRADDPSAVRAIALCLVPLYNLYWFFFVFPRLGSRVNALSRHHNLQEPVPPILVYAFCVLLAIPAAMATAGCLVLMMLFFSDDRLDVVLFTFFLLPGLLAAINYLFVMPVLCTLIQRSINRISAAQLASRGVVES